MTLQGTVVNGNIVLDEPVSLPNGSRVEVEVKAKPKLLPPGRSSLETGRHCGGLAGGHGGTARPLPPRNAEAMNRVFADTFYFLALLNPRDNGHARATAFTAAFRGEMVTTAWVLTELGDALCDPANRSKFVATISHLKTFPQAKIVPADPARFEEGLKLFEARPDKEWSLTDCISFVVMQHEGVTEAMTGDHHFEQAGFVALLK